MYSNSITTQSSFMMSPPLGSMVDQHGPVETTIRTLAGPVHWALFKYVTALTGLTLSDHEKALITDNVKLKKLRKNQYLLQEGDICKYAGFIVKGATRMFSINERGQESIVAFGLDNCLVADHESFTNGDCSGFHIEALEDTEMLIINAVQMAYLTNEIPAFGAMFRQYQLMQLIDAQKRINASLSMTAEERYYDLLQRKPQYAQRFSQNMLASYLGVKPETLSRIRKRS